MTLTLTQLILIQSLLCIGAWLILFRRKGLPIGIQLLAVCSFLTTPLALLVKGTQSAIYASDLLLPFLLASLLFQSRPQRPLQSPLVLTMVFSLVLLPLLLTPFHVFSSGGDVSLGGRNAKGDLIWMYRNLTYLCIFSLAWASQLTRSQFLSFVELQIGLGGILAGIGLLHYFGPVNLAVFEQLTWKEWVEEGYQITHIGLGFMGLFRASVGQWFSTLFLLIAGTWSLLSPRWRTGGLSLLILSSGMILLSHSRAGFVGLTVGVLMLSLLGQGLHHRLIAGIAVIMLIGWIGVQGDLFTDRIGSIVNGTQHATDRVKGWERGFGFLTDHLDALMLGIGPANRQGVAAITGSFGAHNEYLDVIFRLGLFGLVGLLIMLALFLSATFGLRRRLDSQGKTIATTMGIIVIANATMGITQEHFLHDYASHTMGIYLYLLYGVGLGTLRTKETPHEPIETSSEEKGVDTFRHLTVTS
jgi:hypothetical protein